MVSTAGYGEVSIGAKEEWLSLLCAVYEPSRCRIKL